MLCIGDLTNFHYLECLYLARVLDVGTKTQVYKRPAFVDRTALWREQIFDVIHLILAVAKHFLQI